MKARIIFGLSTLALLAAGCQKENFQEGVQGLQTRTFRAVMEQPADTKASVTNEGVFSWNNGDPVTVVDNTGAISEATVTVSGSEAAFSTSFTDPAYATYPHIVNAVAADGKLTSVNLPSGYTAYKGGLNAPMAADLSTVQDVANFRHLTGVLKVSFRSVPAGVDKFVFTTDKNITGIFGLDMDEAIPQIELADASGANGGTVTFTVEETAADAFLDFYIPLPVGEYGSFTLQLFDGETLKFSKSTTQGRKYTIARRDLALLPLLYVEECEYVDLGLSVLWATKNVGADSPEDLGGYFSWGETVAKTGNFNWLNYKWCNGSQMSLTKYCTSFSYGTLDNRTVLEAEDDAAAVNCGNGWRMPTKEEFEELVNPDNCTWEKEYGENRIFMGYRVISRKSGYAGESIFLPAAASYHGQTFYGNGCGFYWSSTLDSEKPYDAYYMTFELSGQLVVSDTRYYGQSVRPVRTK